MFRPIEIPKHVSTVMQRQAITCLNYCFIPFFFLPVVREGRVWAKQKKTDMCPLFLPPTPV